MEDLALFVHQRGAARPSKRSLQVVFYLLLMS
jgi:hypothetical protein